MPDLVPKPNDIRSKEDTKEPGGQVDDDNGAAEAASGFFRALLGPKPPTGLSLVLWSAAGSRTVRFPVSQVDEAARHAAGRDNVYVGVGLQRTGLAGGGRGRAADVAALPGLWVDVDVAGPAHRDRALPATREHARTVIDAFALPPSAVVDSGHGLHGWWWFPTPWRLDDERRRDEAAWLARRFQATLRAAAREHGWHLDATHDLARVLRIPGSVNRKPGLDPAAVRLVECHPDRRWPPRDFLPHLADEDVPRRPAGQQPGAAGRHSRAADDRDDRIGRIHQRIDLPAEMRRRCGAGQPDGPRIQWHCPLPGHTDRTPSFTVYTRERPQRFHCFGCGAHGDVIDLVARLDRIDTAEAIGQLAAQADARPDGPPPTLGPAAADGYPVTPVRLDSWVHGSRQALTDGDGETARAYLQSRGVTRSEIARFELGVGRPSHVAALDRLAGRVIIPCLPHGVDARAVDGTGPRYLTVGPKRAWRLDDADPVRGPLVLVEGAFDCITLDRAGVQAVALRGKTLHPHDARAIRTIGFTTVYLALDDDATIEQLQAVMQRLADAGVAAQATVGFGADRDAGDLLTEPHDRLLAAVTAALVVP